MNKLRILLEIFLVSTRLGLTSFGGPTAHLGYFHAEYVERKKWMSEKSYADLVALSQFLPGPASSQVGIGVGVMRGGVLGGLTSFIGFTLPSVIVLMIFASLMTTFDISEAGWIHGLKIVAVVIVLHAILGMSKNLTPDIERKVIALFALVATLLFQSVFTQVGVILIAGVIGFILFKNHEADDNKKAATFPIRKSFSAVCLALFFVLLFALPAFRELTGSYWIAVVDSFYRSGSLVFGGGHVVLPLLEQELVPMGWISAEEFLAGYGATQAVPGPLFTFAAYLGTVMNGWIGGLVATAAIFLPAFLLILGALPFWDMLRNNEKVKGAVMGVNAAVIGILISALYTPIWTSSILEPVHFALAAILFVMLVYFKLPPWVIVVTGAIGGMLIGLL
ncbi:chromate transporter [Jeotgalicoccus nanhaiensis]|uniref:Chromate transporter n=1 Tax=Jeotgalicoccus nanhaiensis TaxID=568603 RepID=A0ABR9XW90_9STAP|nr:chromate transporter [Jeotgalicoccus nanhaiensis]MBF0753187.1 chromate transporter [Jeotgalicoccus nanhaiensis]TFU62358.1 chromate transporter [Jeotgalicoccus nanhaiensis]